MNSAVTNQPNSTEPVDDSMQEVQAGDPTVDGPVQPATDGNNQRLPRIESTPTMKVQSS